VVIEIDGKSVWDALEASLATWPAQEGCATLSSAYWTLVDWRDPADFLSSPASAWAGTPDANLVSECLEFGYKRKSKARKLKLKRRRLNVKRVAADTSCWRENIWRRCVLPHCSLNTWKLIVIQGHDGFLPLKGHKFLIDDESGQMMSAIVRKYLLGEMIASGVVIRTDY
jgi:5'-nucleotidase